MKNLYKYKIVPFVYTYISLLYTKVFRFSYTLYKFYQCFDEHIRGCLLKSGREEKPGERHNETAGITKLKSSEVRDWFQDGRLTRSNPEEPNKENSVSKILELL